MESLKKSDAECERKIELRRKQFGVVLESLSSLKNLIESDTNLEQYLSSQAEMLDDESMMMDSSTTTAAATTATPIITNAAAAAAVPNVGTVSSAIKKSPSQQDFSQPFVKVEEIIDDNDDDQDVEKSEKHKSSSVIAAEVAAAQANAEDEAESIENLVSPEPASENNVEMEEPASTINTSTNATD